MFPPPFLDSPYCTPFFPLKKVLGLREFWSPDFFYFSRDLDGRKQGSLQHEGQSFASPGPPQKLFSQKLLYVLCCKASLFQPFRRSLQVLRQHRRCWRANRLQRSSLFPEVSPRTSFPLRYHLRNHKAFPPLQAVVREYFKPYIAAGFHFLQPFPHFSQSDQEGPPLA